MERGMGQRTGWLDPGALIDSRCGRVSVLTWLTREAERISTATGRLVEPRERAEREGAGKVALFVG